MNTPVSVRAVPALALSIVLLALAACTTPKPADTVTLLAPYPVAPVTAEGYYTDGVTAQIQGDITAAVEAFTQALELDPGYVDARLRRGQAHIVRHEFADAIADLSYLIDRNPGNAMAYFARALANRQAGNYAAALPDYDRGLELAPKMIGGYVDRGITLTALKRDTDAVIDFDHAIALDPAHASAYYNRSIVRRHHGELSGALEDLNRVIALDPQHFLEAYGGRALVWMELKNYAAALVDANHVITTDPKNPFGYSTRGMILAEQKDWAGVLAAYNQALALSSRTVPFLFERGRARNFLKDYAGALSDYTEALAISAAQGGTASPLRVEFIHRARATLYWIQADYPAALADYEAAITPTSPVAAVQYTRFFRHLLLRRLNRANEDNLAALVPAWKPGWPQTIGLYLTGGLSEEKFLAAAETAPDEKTRQGQLCEAYFYAGMNALLDHRLDAASEKFTACLATGVTDFTEYTFARAELSSLPEPATASAPKAP